MTSNARPGTRIVGSLRSADSAGVVRVEERYATDIDDLWSALTDPDRLARWYGQVDGELGLDDEFRMYVDTSGWKGTGRVEACEPPRRLMVTTKELSESFRKTVEATLTSEDDHTVLVIEVRGMPLDKIAFFGAGWQIHTEDLAAYLAGGERGDTEARWDELVPPYQDLASGIAGLGNA